MAEYKKSFIAYADWKETFDKLPDDVAGKLIKHIFAYVNNENPISNDYVIEAIFSNIKNTLKRDLRKWETQLDQRREAGKRSAEQRALKKINERSISLNETQRNSTVSDSVSVSVSVSVSDITKLNNFFLSEIKISDDSNFFIIDEEKIEASKKDIIYFKTAVWFQKLFIKNLKEKNAPTSNQEKATFKKYVIPIRLMFEKDNVTQKQFKEAYEYLDSLEGEFWKKNVLSTTALRDKISQLLIQKNTPYAGKFTNNTQKKQAVFTIAGAEQTLASDFERRQSRLASN